jgi:hypothetical protein
MRKAYHPSELPAFMKRAISEACVDPKHNHLNRLLAASIDAAEGRVTDITDLSAEDFLRALSRDGMPGF